MQKKYRVEDYIGKKVNRWTILKSLGPIRIDKDHSRTHVLVRCECGTEKEVDFYNIVRGLSKSCGCYGREKSSETYKKINLDAGKEVHGLTGTHTYNCWMSMRSRCYNPDNNRYYLYGAQGIEVEWKSFTEFLCDLKIAPSKYHTVDRIDATKNYCKNNCRWATPKEQSNNRTTCCFIEHNGKTQSMMDWARELNIQYRQLEHLVNTKKLSIPEAAKAATRPYKERTRSKDKGYIEFKA